ncbi:SPOR domain-containing protein [Daejeonella sp.]|uniref:SPOR domain-containing protein n=1 Tax=Daejeonella sp. TaxID=2805397 RepID=UPI0025C43940|nr:SPOR domain-containing protein [Daejeonella sp.]
MKWKDLVCFIFFAIGIQVASAQERGQLTVTKDPQIDSLIAKRLALSKNVKSGSNISVSGFRVQVFSGLQRQDAYNEQAKFKVRYPAYSTYISYVQPNYRLRVGDFRTKLEAEKFMNELKKFYSSMFIFSEMIILR